MTTTTPLSPRRVVWLRRRRALGRTWAQYRSSTPGMIGLVILVLFVTMALAAPLQRVDVGHAARHSEADVAHK